MAEIPVERKVKSGFPGWLIPLLALLLLLPLLYYCSRNTAVGDNTNGNYNANRTAVTTGNVGSVNNTANGGIASGGGTSGAGNTAVVLNSNSGAAGGETMNGANGGGSMSGDGRGATSGTASSGAVVKDVNEFGSVSDKASLVGRGFFVNGVRVNHVLSDKVFTVKSGSGEMFVMLDDNLDSPGGKEKQIRMKSGQTVNLGGEFRNAPTAETKDETKGGGLNKNEYARMKGQQVYLHATSVSDAK